MHDSARHQETFRLEVSVRDGCARIRLTGDLDMSRAPRLDEAFDALCSERVSTTIVDASGVSFIDCAGLRSLLTIADEMERNQGTMHVVDASVPVRRILELSGCELLLVAPNWLTGSPDHKASR